MTTNKAILRPQTSDLRPQTSDLRKRVLYIADNRNRGNWGCRATSAALAELISQKYTISGTITGKLTLSYLVYIPFLPRVINKFIHSFPLIHKICAKVLSYFPDSIRRRLGVVSWNFERTIKRIKYLSETVPLFNEINLDSYDYDIAVINGEGTMIMTTPERIDTLMYLLFVYWAKKRGKTVYFILGLPEKRKKCSYSEYYG